MEKKRGPAFWIGCGCLALLVGCSGIGAAGFFGITGLLKSSTPYRDAISRVNSSDAATTALGSPIEAGWWVSGSVSESGGSGNADLSIPVHGPNGKGTVYVKAHRDAGRWTYDRMSLELPGDAQAAEIDLLEGGERIEHL